MKPKLGYLILATFDFILHKIWLDLYYYKVTDAAVKTAIFLP